jgi:ABC-type dipeptide/oligopeptide/nickel transport system permease subunit
MSQNTADIATPIAPDPVINATGLPSPAPRRASFGGLGFLQVVVPAACVVLLVLVAVFAQNLAPHDPYAINFDHRLEKPSAMFLLGTDDLGRDVLSRLIYGSRVSLLVGVVSTLITLLIGLPLGLYAGYVPGRLSAVILRVVDAWLAFPQILLAMIVTTVLGSGIVNISLSIALVFWPGLTRVTRAAVLGQRQLQYVEAAKSLGGSSSYIMFRSILPNILAPLAVQTAFLAAGAILLEAGLTFLGLGIGPPTPSWGGMLQEAKAYLRQDPWFGFFPGLLLLVVVLALNGVADWISRHYARR